MSHHDEARDVIARICRHRLLDGVDVEEHERRSHGNGLSKG
jgi:hypothetical protein